MNKGEKLKKPNEVNRLEYKKLQTKARKLLKKNNINNFNRGSKQIDNNLIP